MTVQTADAPNPNSRRQLKKMTDDELRAACKTCRLKGYGRASRDTLENMLSVWLEQRNDVPNRTSYSVTRFKTLADFEKGLKPGIVCGLPTGHLQRARNTAWAELERAYVARVEGTNGYVETMRRDRDLATLLHTIGPALYPGRVWQTPLARDLGITPRHLEYLQKGRRLAPSDLIQRLEAVAQRRRNEIEDELKVMAQRRRDEIAAACDQLRDYAVSAATPPQHGSSRHEA